MVDSRLSLKPLSITLSWESLPTKLKEEDAASNINGNLSIKLLEERPPLELMFFIRFRWMVTVDSVGFKPQSST